jgi:hypothetical protein
MQSNSVTAPRVFNGNFSDAEILGLLTHSPHRSRHEVTSKGRNAGAQEPATRANSSRNICARRWMRIQNCVMRGKRRARTALSDSQRGCQVGPRLRPERKFS